MSIKSLRFLNVYLMDMQHICTVRYEIIKNMKYSAHTMKSNLVFLCFLSPKAFESDTLKRR